MRTIASDPRHRSTDCWDEVSASENLGFRERPYKTSSYEVCWSTARQVFAETFRAKGLADHYGSRLLRTSNDGEKFDLERPPRVDVRERGTLTWYELTLEYLVMKRPHAAPDTRVGI